METMDATVVHGVVSARALSGRVEEGGLDDSTTSMDAMVVHGVASAIRQLLWRLTTMDAMVVHGVVSARTLSGCAHFWTSQWSQRAQYSHQLVPLLAS